MMPSSGTGTSGFPHYNSRDHRVRRASGLVDTPRDSHQNVGWELEPVTARILERRSFGRRNSAINGHVKVPGRPPIGCVVRNLAPGGALIEFEKSVWLPYRFVLRLHVAGTAFHCEIKHQNKNRVGVRFVEALFERAADAEPGKNVTTADDWIGGHGRALPAFNNRRGR